MKSAPIAAALGLLILSAPIAQAQTSGPLAINVMSTAAFVDNATWNDMFAIQSSRLALEKSEDPKIREFAQATIRDHSRDSARLAAAASTDVATLSPPTVLDRQDGLLLDKLLLASSGAAFDQLYINMMIDHYGQAQQLHRAYSLTGENTALKQLAAATVARERQRLDRVSQLTPAAATDRLASGIK
jgi:putative membrane protein